MDTGHWTANMHNTHNFLLRFISIRFASYMLR